MTKRTPKATRTLSKLTVTIGDWEFVIRKIIKRAYTVKQILNLFKVEEK